MKKSQLKRSYDVQALAAADAVMVPRSELRWLASETTRIIEGLARDVRENKNVMLASLYARWLQFSGVLTLLERESGSQAIREMTADLLYECGQLMRGGKHDPKYAASDIAEINRKLDLLLALEGSDKLGTVYVDPVEYFGFQLVDEAAYLKRKQLKDR